jgi:hypothetical protein
MIRRKNPANKPQESKGPTPGQASKGDDSESDIGNSPSSGTRPVEWLQLIVNGFLAVLAIWALCIYGGQLDVMKGTLTEQSKEFVASHRPWAGIISIDKVGPLVFDLNGVHAQIDHSIKNGGASPAINAIEEGKLVVKIFTTVNLNPFDRLSNAPEFICKPDITAMLHQQNMGLFLLPGDGQPFPSGPVVAQRQDIPTGDTVEVFWVGCIGYFDDSDKPHGTSFVYQYVALNGQKAFPPKGAVEGKVEPFGLSKAY